MIYEKHDIISFNRGEYLVLDIINYNGETYLYLINNDNNKNDVSIVKAVNTNGFVDYVQIEKNKEFDIIVKKFLISMKDDVKKFVSGE